MLVCAARDRCPLKFQPITDELLARYLSLAHSNQVIKLFLSSTDIYACSALGRKAQGTVMGRQSDKNLAVAEKPRDHSYYLETSFYA